MKCFVGVWLVFLQTLNVGLSSAGSSFCFLAAFLWLLERKKWARPGWISHRGLSFYVYQQKIPMTAKEIEPGPHHYEGSGPLLVAADVSGEASYISGMCCDRNIFSVYCSSILTSDLLPRRCLWWICNAGSRALTIPDLFGVPTFYRCVVREADGSNRKCWNAPTGRRSPERSNIRAEGSSGCLDVCEGGDEHPPWFGPPLHTLPLLCCLYRREAAAFSVSDRIRWGRMSSFTWSCFCEELPFSSTDFSCVSHAPVLSDANER